MAQKVSAQEASAWAKGPLSQVRLVSGGLDGGVHRTGVEIRLENGAHTYWRLPGDGGVPPEFDFSASTNLKSAQVRYPAPERSGQPGSQVFGYGGEVIFPVQVTPVDPARPVILKLSLNYAACEKICVPGKASLTLQLSPTGQSPATLARLQAFEARVPRALSNAGAPKFTIQPLPAPDRWQLAMATGSGIPDDLFVEGPDGWYFETRKLESGAFEIALVERPPGAAPAGLPDAVMLTLTAKSGSFDGRASLPLPLSR